MKKIKNKLIALTPETRLYQIPVPIIGLTGGIATGKSTVAKILKERNFPIIDADGLVKKIYQKKDVINFIAKEFPVCFIEQKIDFKLLREVAFSSPENIAKIETKIYQYMPEEFKLAFANFNNPSFIIYDVPLLFEKALDQLVDVKVCVYSPKEIQIKRLINRDQCTQELAEKIISKQLDIELKKSKADFVIENTSDSAFLENQLNHFINSILEE